MFYETLKIMLHENYHRDVVLFFVFVNSNGICNCPQMLTFSNNVIYICVICFSANSNLAN